MINTLTLEQKQQFDEIMEMLGESLDITETQYTAAVKSYGAVGEWLAKPESPLAPYKPVIRPQGSFMLGTMIKSINEKDDLDIDLVCELTGKAPQWAQSHLKKAVGDRLKENELYRNMLDEEGRRCWTLEYADSANYHMDILPSLVCYEYNIVLEKSFSAAALTDSRYDTLAIRITDKEHEDYYTDTIPEHWLKSNPFGYAKWFFNEASIEMRKSIALSEMVNPVPKYQKEKLPLQRVIQILKRHRDMMFNGDEKKPISIIITTLASKAYKKETSIIDALISVATTMRNQIEEKYDYNAGRKIKWIANPVNVEENFADKWVECPQKEVNFYRWLDRLEQDIQNIVRQVGIPNISKAMKNSFGEQTVIKIISALGDKYQQLRQSEALRMSIGTGTLSTMGPIVTTQHHFHGSR